MRPYIVWLWLWPLVFLCACTSDNWGPEALGRGRTSQAQRQVDLGRQVYASYCVGCHGEKGDGNGPAARFLYPKPRDFRVGRIKFAAVASGDAPSDEDYMRVISHGLSGTAMPSFALLAERERIALVSYIKGFFPGWSDESPGGTLNVGEDPWLHDTAGGVESGRRTYHAFAKCWTCHPAYESTSQIVSFHSEAKLPPPELRKNLYEGETKESGWGTPIRAPDFLFDRVKTGLDVNTLSQVIGVGVGGTAMPTWIGALDGKQIWGLAYYVRSIAILRGMPEGDALKKSLLSQSPQQGAVR